MLLAFRLGTKLQGEDEIDNLLDKLRVDNALKELHKNQEEILKNQQAIKTSLSAIEELLHKRLHRRAKAVATLPSVTSTKSAPSYSGLVSWPCSLEESPATPVSSTLIPGPSMSNTTFPSQVMSPPSSFYPDHPNSRSVVQMGELPCSSVSHENVTPVNRVNEEDIESCCHIGWRVAYALPLQQKLFNGRAVLVWA